MGGTYMEKNLSRKKIVVFGFIVFLLLLGAFVFIERTTVIDSACTVYKNTRVQDNCLIYDEKEVVSEKTKITEILGGYYIRNDMFSDYISSNDNLLSVYNDENQTVLVIQEHEDIIVLTTCEDDLSKLDHYNLSWYKDQLSPVVEVKESTDKYIFINKYKVLDYKINEEATLELNSTLSENKNFTTDMNIRFDANMLRLNKTIVMNLEGESVIEYETTDFELKIKEITIASLYNDYFGDTILSYEKLDNDITFNNQKYEYQDNHIIINLSTEDKEDRQVLKIEGPIALNNKNTYFYIMTNLLKDNLYYDEPQEVTVQYKYEVYNQEYTYNKVYVY